MGHKLIRRCIRAGALDQRERLDDCGRSAGVGRRLIGSDHVIGVNREADGVGHPSSIGTGQRDRCFGRELCPIRLPERGGRLAQPAGDEAEFSEILARCAFGREQAHGAGILFQRLTIILEHDVIDPRTDKVDRTGNARGIDHHPVTAGERTLERYFLRELGICANIPRSCSRASLRRIAGIGDGSGLRRFGIEIPHPDVPPENEQARKHDGEQKIALVVQDDALKECETRCIMGLRQCVFQSSRNRIMPAPTPWLAAQ